MDPNSTRDKHHSIYGVTPYCCKTSAAAAFVISLGGKYLLETSPAAPDLFLTKQMSGTFPIPLTSSFRLERLGTQPKPGGEGEGLKTDPAGGL